MAEKFNTRVWRGDPTTVPEARAEFLADPDGQLIRFGVVLYSLRSTKNFAHELCGLHARYMTRAYNLTQTTAVRENQHTAEVLSTHLEWMSRQPILKEQQQQLHESATKVCLYGIHCAFEGPEPGREHTWYQLRLTLAQLAIHEKNYTWAIFLLRRMRPDRVTMEDNQRARVYRKLGFLKRKCGKYISGFYWGIKAIFVSGPTAVRAKSIAALFGIER